MRFRFSPGGSGELTGVAAGGWDCHAHVIGDTARYPLWSGRGYDPPFAPLEDYLALLDRRGLAHGVLVQPSVYGFDNSCLLDSLDRSEGRLFGVVVPAPESKAKEFEAMHRRGVRGIRCNVLNPGGLPHEAAIGWGPMLREMGWHVELHIAIDDIDDLPGFVRRFPIPVVVDHMGRCRADRGAVPSPQFTRLVELVRDGECFVKLSAPYRLSSSPPPWRDVTPLARTLAAANPAGCVWATDWPHTSTEIAVEEEDIFAVLAAWCPNLATRTTLMAGTPLTLFGSG